MPTRNTNWLQVAIIVGGGLLAVYFVINLAKSPFSWLIP